MPPNATCSAPVASPHCILSIHTARGWGPLDSLHLTTPSLSRHLCRHHHTSTCCTYRFAYLSNSFSHSATSLGSAVKGAWPQQFGLAAAGSPNWKYCRISVANGLELSSAVRAIDDLCCCYIYKLSSECFTSLLRCPSWISTRWNIFAKPACGFVECFWSTFWEMHRTALMIITG